LVFGDVELVGKVTLFEFGDPKGFGKHREGHLEETEGIDETDFFVADHFQEFAPITELFDFFVVIMVLVQPEIPIVPLKIDVDSTRLVQGEGT